MLAKKMEFLIKYKLSSSSLEDEKKGIVETIELIQNHSWEDEIEADGQKGTASSINIIEESNERILIVTVREKKEDVLFSVASLRTGKKQKGKIETLINDVPHGECVNVVELFCRGDYSSIDELDNTGIFSQMLRKFLFLFAETIGTKNLRANQSIVDNSVRASLHATS